MAVVAWLVADIVAFHPPVSNDRVLQRLVPGSPDMRSRVHIWRSVQKVELGTIEKSSLCLLVGPSLMPMVEDSFLGNLWVVIPSQFAYCLGHQPRHILLVRGFFAESNISVLQTKDGFSISSYTRD